MVQDTACKYISTKNEQIRVINFETSKKMNKKSRIFVRDFLIYTIINLNPFRGNISNKRIVMLNKYQCYIYIFQ